MTHIDEGNLQAFLDGELHLDERRRAELHLETCELCRQELVGLKGVATSFSSAARLLDAAPRPGGQVLARPATGRGSALRRHLPKAAVFLLFVGAGASATVPGSPVRAWIEELTERPAGIEATAGMEREIASTPAAEGRVEAGVSVESADGSVEIVVQDAASLAVRAVLVDGTRAGVYAGGGSASSRFVTSAGRIEVLAPNGGDLRIEVPRGTPLASVTINGREVLRQQDGRLDLSASGPDLDAAGVAFSVEP